MGVSATLPHAVLLIPTIAMSANESYESLISWCRAAPLETGTSLIGEGHWGFHAVNGALGVAWFSWFRTRGELLRYLADCFPFDYHADLAALRDDPSLMLRAAHFGVAARRYEAGQLAEDLFLAILSDAYPDVTVQWIGTFGEMLYGGGSFACEWRADFRGLDITQGAYAIEDAEMDDVLRAMAWT